MDRLVVIVLGVLGMLLINRVSEFHARQQNLELEALRVQQAQAQHSPCPPDMAAPGPDLAPESSGRGATP